MMTEPQIRQIVKEEIRAEIAENNRVNNQIVFDEIETRMARVLGVAMEEFASQVRVIAEYTQNVDENLRLLTGKVDNHEQRLVKAGL